MKDVFKNSYQIKLSEKEKNDIYSRLVREVELSRLYTMSESSLGKQLFSIKYKTMGVTALGLIAAIVLGGGVSYAATDSLPGDILYPVKTQVNEQVRGWFTIGDEDEVEYRAQLAERRLQELEQLSQERSERLVEVSENVQARFERHIQLMQERLDSLGEEDPDLAADLSARIENALENHARILRQLEERSETLGSVAERAQVAQGAVSQKRQVFEEQSRERSEEMGAGYVGGRIEAAQNMVRAAEELLDSNKNISEESRERAREVMGEVNILINEAEALNGSGDYKEAIMKLQEARQFVYQTRSAVSLEQQTGIQNLIQERVREHIEENVGTGRYGEGFEENTGEGESTGGNMNGAVDGSGQDQSTQGQSGSGKGNTAISEEIQ